MHLTEDNLKEVAAQYYMSIGCTGEAEFEKDLDLSRKISQQLNKLERGDSKANPRLLMNYVVTLFNCFDYLFARELLVHVVEEKNYGRLKALLFVLNRAPFNYLPDHEVCVNTTNLLKSELA